MSQLHRTKQIRRALLEALASAHPYALPVDTLLDFVDDQIRPPMHRDERTAATEWATIQKYAARTAGALDPDAAEMVITELGRSLLASL